MDLRGIAVDGIRFLAQHFLSLTWQDRTPASRGGSPNPIGRHVAVSGAVVSIAGNWFLITAGHILAEIAEAREQGQILEQWGLDDSWSWKAREVEDGAPETVPLNFDDAWKIHVYDKKKGIDYALVHIEPFLTQALKAHGIVPIDEDSWKAEWPTSFDGYVVMGLPSKLVTERSDGMKVEKDLVALGVRVDSDPPATLKREFPRWYGRIVEPLPLELLGKQFDDIDGLSGGPLFAFRRDEAGQLRYWIIGVQSGWDPPTQSIAVCPMQEFLLVVERRLTEPSGQVDERLV